MEKIMNFIFMFKSSPFLYFQVYLSGRVYPVCKIVNFSGNMERSSPRDIPYEICPTILKLLIFTLFTGNTKFQWFINIYLGMNWINRPRTNNYIISNYDTGSGPWFSCKEQKELRLFPASETCRLTACEILPGF